MRTSWTMYWWGCKSRLSAIARRLYLSRQDLRAKNRELKNRLEAAHSEIAALKAEVNRLKQVEQQQQAEIDELNRRDAERAAMPVRLPEDPNVPGHQFGPNMISLCANLASSVGLRPAVKALRLMQRWLGIEFDIPTWQSIRNWMRRIGLARIQLARKKKGSCWIVDHSNQIGMEKLMVILRVRGKFRSGRALRLSDVEVIAVIPKEKWNAETVGQVYQDLVKIYGKPRCILGDGAPELRDAVKLLPKKGGKTFFLRDLKHAMSNRLEALLQEDEKFAAFMKQVGSTRSLIQQTELSHLTPRTPKLKARFMNLQPVLDWAAMALWQLDHPQAEGRSGISEERVQQKLGWLSDYRKELQVWQDCQKIVSLGVKFAAEQGIYRGAAADFEKQVAELAKRGVRQKLVKKIVDFIRTQEEELKGDERFPFSTETIESAFGLYKQFEGQHSKGGFTTLLPVFASLLRETTPKSVSRDLKTVKNKDVQAWTAANLPTTLASKRQKAYREYRASLNASSKRATPLAAST